ncbi:actin-related protein 2/3 complex subunit 5-like protein isoform X2 [Mustela nigripes]|uniref:actin-related protein 2/3 complex subunit 5-like protein isoform X2 n=1 Tax=Mustela nigripes TaxID=77151 RepID=UPI00281598D5|nr:actin-related protein 2/3 complex subunit 5-like protein isoform X2 [Mustela nigripes]
MARNTLSSRFRRVDIDEFDENKFVDEQEEAAAAAGEPGPDPSEDHPAYPIDEMGSREGPSRGKIDSAAWCRTWLMGKQYQKGSRVGSMARTIPRWRGTRLPLQVPWEHHNNLAEASQCWARSKYPGL